MLSRQYFYVLIGLFTLTPPILAEVILDGSLGREGALSGPAYRIGAELGQQHGGNLFHSFRDFNLQSHESANFFGPETVNNIIGRVTGGNPSSIDGIIRSTIPNADLYLINPAGLVFGPNAQLDVPGSFHASTADTLRFQEGGEFNAHEPENSLLSVAPVAAFGFLSDSPAPLSIEGAQLSVSHGKTFSLIAGNLSLNHQASIAASAGHFNLASVTGKGDVKLMPENLSLSAEPAGKFNVQDSRVSVSGEGGGSIVIRAGQLILDNGQLEAETLGHEPGQGIDIQTQQLTITRGGRVSSDTFGTGPAGDISVQVAGPVVISGTNAKGQASAISSNTRPAEAGYRSGEGGHVVIAAETLLLEEGGKVTASSIAPRDKHSGSGGQLTIQIAGEIQLAGVNPSGEDEEGFGSGLYARAQGKETENAGNLLIEARSLSIMDGAVISSSTSGQGQGGSVTLRLGEMFTIVGSDATAVASKEPAESQLAFQQQFSNLAQQPSNIFQPTGVFSDSRGSERDSGNAGTINIGARIINLIYGGKISSAAQNADGGDISITAKKFLYMLQGGKITASVSGDNGHGGNISISEPQLIVLNDSEIVAQAAGGDGGNITLIADHFQGSFDSLTDASSPEGNLLGQVIIDAQLENLGKMNISPEGFLIAADQLNADDQLSPPCSARLAENLSSLVIIESKGGLSPPDDLLPSGLLLSKPLKTSNFYPSSNEIIGLSLSKFAQSNPCQIGNW